MTQLDNTGVHSATANFKMQMRLRFQRVTFVTRSISTSL